MLRLDRGALLWDSLPVGVFYRSAIFSVFFPALAVAASWKIEKIDGRDAVPLDQVAAFYRLGPVVGGSGKIVNATSGARSLRVRLDSREVVLNGVRHWLSFPVRKRGNTIWISRLDVTKTIDPVFRPEGIAGLRAFDTVILDAGHGGHDRGASSVHGVENEYALDLARRMRTKLQRAGLRVVMTRDSDEFIPLESRPAVASRHARSIFVSLHFNDASWRPTASGIEVFCIPPRGALPTGQDKTQARDLAQLPGHDHEPQSFALANAIFHAMRGKSSAVDRGVKRARFKVLQVAKVPSVLVEAGFLTNPTEGRQIANPAWRDAMADSIVAGILEYRKLAAQKTPPRTVTGWGGRATTDFVTDQ